MYPSNTDTISISIGVLTEMESEEPRVLWVEAAA